MVDFQEFMRQQQASTTLAAPPPTAPPPSLAPAPAPAAPGASRYAGIESADVMGQGNRRVCDCLGLFTGEVMEIRDGNTQTGGLEVFAVTLKVTSSDNPAVSPGALLDWAVTGPHPKWGKKYYFMNIKSFICSMVGCAPEAVTPDLIEQLKGQNQPARGAPVGWQVFQKANKQGQVVNRTNFHRHIPQA